MVARDGPSPLLEQELADVCGEDAAEVLATFRTFLQALAFAGRRRLRIGWGGYAGITPDERQLLSLVAAAQAGDRPQLEAHLRWLAGAERRATLAIATQALGAALAAHGMRLPPPHPSMPLAGEFRTGHRVGAIDARPV
jgi:hypothetical protein